jgi:peptide/nickel transport system substrate-binding protein
MRSQTQCFATAALAAALLLAPGCGPEPPCFECGTLVIAIGSDADLLNPALAQGSGRVVSDQLFLKLADVGLGANTVRDSGFIGRLARSWRFEDDRTIVFTMHPEARWHDGAPVTARDVAFTFAAYRDTLLASPARPLLEDIDSVVARDDRTAVFHFRRAYPSQFFDATHHMRILPAHLLDTVPREQWRTHAFSRNPVGTGPFRLAAWRPGDAVEIVADSGHFLGRASLDRVIFKVAPDFNATITQLLAGDADFVEAVVGPENVARVSAAEDVRVIEYAASVYMYLGFNLRLSPARGQPAPHPLFAERELRRAIALGIDREAIIGAVLDGRGTVPPGPTTPMVWIHQGAPRQLSFDSARAAGLLDSLGWRDADGDGVRERGGRRLRFEALYPSSSAVRQRAGVIMQEQLRRLGVDLQLVPMELNALLERARAGRFDAMIGAWQIALVPTGLRELWTSAGVGTANFGSYASPEFDAKVEDAAAENDLGRARALWHEAIGIINEDAPAVWLFAPNTVAAANQRVGNITVRPDEWWTSLWTWSAGRREAARGSN